MPRCSPGNAGGDDLARRWRALPTAACRHWCRTAPPSARRHHRPSWRRPAHSRDWPCSRRRNARSRPSPPCRRRRAASTDAVMRVEVFLVGAAERHAHMIVPALGDEADGVATSPAAAPRGPDRWRRRRRPAWSCRRRRIWRCAVRFFGEEGGVGRIGAGIAALDIVDAELVEHARQWRSCPRRKSRCPASAGRRAASCRRGRCVALVIGCVMLSSYPPAVPDGARFRCQSLSRKPVRRPDQLVENARLRIGVAGALDQVEIRLRPGLVQRPGVAAPGTACRSGRGR